MFPWSHCQPSQNASLLLWQCFAQILKCISLLGHSHNSLQHVSPPSISQSSAAPEVHPRRKRGQAAAPKKTLGESMHWQIVIGSSFQQGCLKNIPLWSLGDSYARDMDTQHLCAVVAKSKNFRNLDKIGECAFSCKIQVTDSWWTIPYRLKANELEWLQGPVLQFFPSFLSLPHPLFKSAK